MAVISFMIQAPGVLMRVFFIYNSKVAAADDILTLLSIKV